MQPKPGRTCLRYMKFNGPFLLFFALQISLSPIAGYSQDVPALSAIIEKEGNENNFSGTVLIARGDSILLVKSVGFANREKNILNDSATRFNIASTGKLFTRIVILQLIQEGKISLEDRITKFYEGFDQPGADQITIFHLLDHKSGLGDVLVSKEYLKRENFSSTDNVVKLIAKERLKFPPGSDDQYSNSGYYMLSAIIEKITGMSFAAAVTKMIFEPLGITNSGFAKTGDVITNHALPYLKKGSKIKASEIEITGEPPSGAGSEYATVHDLFKVYRSIIKDEILLNKASKAALFNKFQPGNWDEILTSKKITGYLGGDTRGWSAKLTFMFNPQTQYGVVILANFDDMAHPLDLKLREVINKAF